MVGALSAAIGDHEERQAAACAQAAAGAAHATNQAATKLAEQTAAAAATKLQAVEDALRDTEQQLNTARKAVAVRDARVVEAEKAVLAASPDALRQEVQVRQCYCGTWHGCLDGISVAAYCCRRQRPRLQPQRNGRLMPSSGCVDRA